MPDDRRRTRAEERAHAQMLDELDDLEYQNRKLARRFRLIPDGWYEAHKKAPTVPHKDRVTLRLDKDMLAWYRNLGRGWQPRINTVLRAYMRAVISKEIEMRGDRDGRGRPI